MSSAITDRLIPVARSASKSENSRKQKRSAPDSKRRVAGGAATGGGVNFQAAVTAIVYAYVMRGRPLKWLDGLHDDIPVSVDAETGKGGDDIQLVLQGGRRCDVQVKRGLQRGDDLWDPLLAMGKAISEGKIGFGVLAVSTSSSSTIREDLANAIFRIGDGRTDDLPEIARAFLGKLDTSGLARSVCKTLRIVTLSAATHDGASIAAARAELGHVCQAGTIDAAWNTLYRDGIELIDRRGRRELSSLVQLLKANNVGLIDDVGSPAGLLSALADWTISTNATFSIFGVKKPLRLSEAWIPLHAIVREEQVAASDPMAALQAYQSWHSREYSRDTTSIDPETLGRFIKLAVLVAGPGMGKSTLLSRIAQAYAKDGIPVLSVRLASVAARIQSGETFEEAVFALGLAGSAISVEAARGADIRNWVLLCDGLDETGAAQVQIASAAERFAIGHPECRVIVTTRPVGYHASDLGAWRHYDIMPIDRLAAHQHLTRLLREIGIQGSRPVDDPEEIARAELEEDAVATTILRSPLLLSLGASLIARGGSLGLSRNRLYEQLFGLVDEAPNSRTPEPPAQSVVLRRFLDILGWQISSNPIASVNTVVANCAKILEEELGMKPLAAQAAAQSYLRYWQDVGLIERVGLQGVEILTFLHKTFGEFAAARFLVALPTAERTVTLSLICNEESWEEVLNFAAMRGLAGDVCTLLIEGIAFDAAGIARVVRCLEICGEADLVPSEQVRHAILDYALAVIMSPRRERAAEVGIALVPHAQRFPDEVAARCVGLTSHAQSWTRLAAWAALVAAGPNHLEVSRLQMIIRDEASLADSGMWSSGKGRDLAQAFVLGGARLLLEHYPGPATDEAVAAALRTENLGSMGFLQRASRLLKDFGKPVNVWPEATKNNLDRFIPSIDFLDAQRKAFFAQLDAVDGCGGTVEVQAAGGSKLLNLSALFHVTNYMELPLSDVWNWQDPFDPAPVRETLRAAIEASGIPRDILEHEVRIARSAIVQGDAFVHLFPLIADVDLGPVDWKQALACEPDLQKIEAALYHRSPWVIWIAATLLEALADNAALQGITRRAIAGGRGETLWAAAGFAVNLDKAEMASAIYDRLCDDLSYGCDHLLLALPDLAAPVDGRLLAALEAAFLHGLLETAMAAGKLAVRYASPDISDLLPILDRAAAHWKIKEKPYPKNGGVVPNSPRVAIAEARAATKAPTYENLKVYLTDTRSDMRELGSKTLVTCLSGQPQLALTFLADIEEGAVSADILDKALTNGVGWKAEPIAMVNGFLNSSTKALRFAAMAVLRQEYCQPEFIRSEATRMTEDPDRQIRERAYRILDTLRV
ncbi:NACHT domain-containing protein [Rhizobium rhizogenes]|uniref:NACHT domain-containing protein n=1 Tax=Rhizobium rhizogenes TaxID=359 RepID=UPI000A9D28EA|nr:hypothetical protein [Rhizobium rhizogenes]NTF82454.1 hypothetical protein [Rhizobium rhizogenes]